MGTGAATATDTSPAQLQQQALAWLVTMWSGEATAADHQALNDWRQSSPAHEQAWLAVQQIEQRLRTVPAATGGRVLRAAASNSINGSKSSNSRRAVLRSLALMCGSGAALYTLHDSQAWHTMTAQYATATGEQRELLLDDGTRITMNTATALDVRFEAGQRRIELHRGEIMITTGADGHRQPFRPFVVATAHGTARALGTRFVVYQQGAHTKIQVYEGAVELRPRQRADGDQRVNVGQQAGMTAQAAEAPQPLATRPPAWLDGVLEAEQMRLPDFLAELERYRPGVIHCDPALAGLTVSGVYPLADTGKILDALAQALPVRVSYRTRYWVQLGPR